MTDQRDGSPAARPPRRRWLLVALTVIIVLGIIALALLVGYVFFRPPGPAPVGTDAPLIPEGWLSGPIILALATTLG
jgi:hypothetical protein